MRFRRFHHNFSTLADRLPRKAIPRVCTPDYPLHGPPLGSNMADNRDKLQDFIDAFTEEIKLLDASGT